MTNLTAQEQEIQVNMIVQDIHSNRYWRVLEIDTTGRKTRYWCALTNVDRTGFSSIKNEFTIDEIKYYY